jgi:hypothetical protein
MVAINVEPEASLAPNALFHPQTLKSYMRKNLKRQMGMVENYRVAKLHPHWLIDGRLEPELVVQVTLHPTRATPQLLSSG